MVAPHPDRRAERHRAVALLAVDFPHGTITVGVFALIGVPALMIGWFAARKNIAEIDAARDGYTGPMPTTSGSPAIQAAESRGRKDD